MAHHPNYACKTRDCDARLRKLTRTIVSPDGSTKKNEKLDETSNALLVWLFELRLLIGALASAFASVCYFVATGFTRIFQIKFVAICWKLV
jgi:hypothetical protein